MKKDWVKHVTLDGDTFICLNCNGKFKYGFPIPLTDWLKKSKAFIALHKDCKPIIKP